MNLRTFFRKSVLGAGALIFCISLGVGLLQPTKTEALSLGGLGGTIASTAAQQEKVKKSLDYYENDGRNELFAELKKSDGVIDDSDLNEELGRIMTRLTSAIAKTDPSIMNKPYNYFINPQTAFNAYCSLGHNVSVNVGVFSFFDNDEGKIAAVVAHELVHGQKGHPINGAKKKLTVDFIQKIAGSQMSGGGQLAVDIVATNAKAVGVTKPNEWEADNVAFSYITEAGYNPGTPAAVWQRVIDNMGKGGSKGLFDDLLNPSTHPGEKERRDNYAKKLTEYSNNKVSVNPATGDIKVNNKPFMKPAAFSNMSALERSYLIAGHLAAVYHSKESLAQATNDNGVVRIGDVAIVQTCSADTDADELVKILNEIQ
ncbi:putative Zn-dependent protease [Sporomusaceae bacterium BoRhaA]|uniref:M48 family metallopeptidase n=1 Tax=Pelorhabdus rhamnosifermentans TaxID=2772457 RepID=UPI001C060639|nr:M48 family metallopeptidase [Pelorhabdus rhamnosifermentans]MBU2703313.1 putative Zn-dependent protease [Pelorhabdus rhamnosifermentans]